MWPEINNIPILDWTYFKKSTRTWHYLWNDELWVDETENEVKL